jgi:transketolase
MLFEQAIIAVEILKQEGLSVGFINIRSIKPIDEEAILKVIETSKLVIILEDHFMIGGLYTIVAEILLRHRKTGWILPLNLKEKWFKPALLDQVLEYEGFTGKAIAAQALATYEIGIIHT